jgi:ABC-type siderophore export system fused ATPase/permease subunit
MLEILVVLILLAIAFLGIKSNPFLRHYQQNREESEGLIRKYNRMLKARKELMGHFDWAVSRGDPVASISSLGREIERMDREMH